MGRKNSGFIHKQNENMNHLESLLKKTYHQVICKPARNRSNSIKQLIQQIMCKTLQFTFPLYNVLVITYPYRDAVRNSHS